MFLFGLIFTTKTRRQHGVTQGCINNCLFQEQRAQGCAAQQKNMSAYKALRTLSEA